MVDASLAINGEMNSRMVAVVLTNPGKKGKEFRIANEKDFQIFHNAEVFLEEKITNWNLLDTPLPNENITNLKGRINIYLYGMKKWKDLFNSRQKLTLITIMEKIKLVYKPIKTECGNLNLEKYGINPDEAAKAVIGYLGAIFNGAALSLSNLSRYRGDHESFQKIFARQSLPMIWDYGEINGLTAFRYDWYIKGILGACFQNSYKNIKITTTQHSASSLSFPDNHFDAVFTDPPYYDNVPYADLSDFFYVWLKRTIGEEFPDLFTTPTVPKDKEIVYLSHLCDSYKNRTKTFFESELSKSFKEINRILKKDGIATIVYAHKSTEGWESMLNSLVNSNLVVTASWPIHTEMKSRLIASHTAALASSIYMVCRKTQKSKVGFYMELTPKIKNRVEEKLQQFWDEGIAGGDFLISAIGPGMEIFSQYERVEKLSGEQVTTSELLDYIRTVSTDFIVNKLLKNATATKIDNESEFYLAYRWTYLDNTVEYDDARKLASASGITLERYWGSDGFIKKSDSKISVLGPKERDKIDKTNSMVDVMHKAVLLWEKSEKDKLTQLLAETGYGKDLAFKQFCQAIAESLLNGNKEKQLLEGFLIGIDSYKKAKVKIGKDQTDLSQYGGV